MKNRFWIPALYLSFIAASCNKDALPAYQPDSAFTPLIIGQSAEYEVERRIYSLSSPPEIQHFSTRQEIADSLRDINNQLIYRIEHYFLDDKSKWRSDSVSASWQTLDKSVSRENGQTIVKMIYPITSGLSWNGNLFNSLEEKIFWASDVRKPYIIESQRFPDTVKIIRQDDSTLLSKNTFIEIYALNIGLIRSEKMFVKYCNTPDCIGQGIINSGWAEIRTIKYYGKQ